MISLQTLKDEFAQLMVNETIATRMSDWIYWVLIDILASGEYWWNKRVETFTSTSGTAIYFLNHRCNMKQVRGFFDATNNRELHERDLEWIYRQDTTPTETGTPDYYAFMGEAEVQALNTSAGTVSVVSSSTDDVNMKLLVRGKVSGYERLDQLTLNGTSTVAGTLTFDANEIESCVLSAECAGVVTVTCGSVTIVVLPPGYKRIRTPKIRLYQVPGGAYSYVYTFFQRAVKPTNASDIIDIPDEAFKCLRYGIEEIGHLNNGDIDFSNNAHEKYETARRELFNWSMRNINKKDVKEYRPSRPFGFTLPETMSHTLTG